MSAGRSTCAPRRGDKIRIVQKWSRYDPYEVGDILYVDRVLPGGVEVRGLVANEATVIHDSEYEVI